MQGVSSHLFHTIEETDNRVRIVAERTAPLIHSTPFQIISYQKIAEYLERCCFFCGFFQKFDMTGEKTINKGNIHKIFTAFATLIRPPPSEIWIRHLLNCKGGLQYGRQGKILYPH